MLVALGIILFIGLIMFHEWGHFMAAHRNGVETEEFGLGFPPRLWGKKLRAKKGDQTLYSVNLLPLGGFVKMKGEHDQASGKGSFGAASLRGKAKILLAGVFMNLLAAYFIFMLLAVIGMPKVIDNQFTVNRDTKIIREVQDKDVVLVGRVGDGSPAQKAGLKENDRIVRVNDTAITSPDMLIGINKDHAGKPITLVYARDNQETSVNITLSDNKDGKGYLGVSPMSGESGVQLQRSTWSAPIVAGGLIGQVTALTFKGLGSAIAGLSRGDAAAASEQVSGPVGLFAILKAGSTLGINFILFVIGLISLALAIMNLLPVPALDGGRLYLLLFFRFIKKPLTKEREERIVGFSFAALMILFVLITIVDIKRFF